MRLSSAVRSVLLALVCCALVAGLTGTSSASQAKSYSPIDYQGVLKAVAAQKGKVVVVNFWATWCPPCLIEIPHLMDIRKEFPEERMHLMGVSLDEDGDVLAAFLAKRKLNYPIFLGDRSVLMGFRVSGVPRIMVYDSSGALVLSHEGYLEPEVLKDLIKKYLPSKDVK